MLKKPITQPFPENFFHTVEREDINLYAKIIDLAEKFVKSQRAAFYIIRTAHIYQLKGANCFLSVGGFSVIQVCNCVQFCKFHELTKAMWFDQTFQQDFKICLAAIVCH